MNHFKKGSKVALLGENYFPPVNNSHITRKREEGLDKIMQVLVHHKPSVVYICPTKGVNINLLPFILLNNIPFRLVFPSKHFFTYLNEEEKQILNLACAKADKVIILSEKDCNPLRWSDDWFEATKKAVDNSDWVLIAHSLDDIEGGFTDLLKRFDGNPKPVLAIDFGAEARYR